MSSCRNHRTTVATQRPGRNSEGFVPDRRIELGPRCSGSTVGSKVISCFLPLLLLLVHPFFPDALYTLSTSSDRVEKTMRKLVDKLNKSNVNLQRRHKEGQREPTLIITDPLNDSDLEKHLQDSLNLRKKNKPNSFALCHRRQIRNIY